MSGRLIFLHHAATVLLLHVAAIMPHTATLMLSHIVILMLSHIATAVSHRATATMLSHAAAAMLSHHATATALHPGPLASCSSMLSAHRSSPGPWALGALLAGGQGGPRGQGQGQEGCCAYGFPASLNLHRHFSFS